MEKAAREPSRMGAKVRALRRREALSQVQLAERLGISPEKLPEPHPESNRRPLPAGAPHQARAACSASTSTPSPPTRARAHDLGPPRGLRRSPLRGVQPHVDRDARARDAEPRRGARRPRALPRVQERAGSRPSRSPRASRPVKRAPRGRRAALRPAALPSEEVGDLIQQHMNHFPESSKTAPTELRKKGKPRRRRALLGPHSLPPPRRRTACRCASRGGGPTRESSGGTITRRRSSRSPSSSRRAAARSTWRIRSPSSPQGARLERPHVRHGDAHDRRVALARARRARQLLRRRGAHAVHDVPPGGARRALRHRRARPAVPRRLRAGVPPAHDPAKAGRQRAFPCI